MGGGRSGLYHKTQGARSIVNTFIGNFPYGRVCYPSNGGTGQSGFAGQNGTGVGAGYGVTIKKKKQVIEIVVALIWDKDKFLICRSFANKARRSLWELVAVNVKEGEAKEQALIRKCQEELAVTVKPQNIFTGITHDYTDVTIRITAFNCGILQGQPQLLRYSDIKWISTKEIDNYDFCSVDKQILEKIKIIKRSD